jgi:hypothetical protein
MPTDGVDRQEFADFASRARVSTIADGQVLLFKNRVEHLPINHAIRAVLHEFGDEQAVDTLTHVDGSHRRRDRTVFEGHHGDAPFVTSECGDREQCTSHHQ